MLDPRIDQRLADDVSNAEGNVLTPYKDTMGDWTVGRGHRLYCLTPPPPITEAQSDAYFVDDLIHATAFASGLEEYPYCDTAARKNALIELVFNMGTAWLHFVHCRSAMIGNDWQTAHDQLLQSEWAAEVHGARAQRLAGYFLTGQYP